MKVSSKILSPWLVNTVRQVLERVSNLLSFRGLRVLEGNRTTDRESGEWTFGISFDIVLLRITP